MPTFLNCIIVHELYNKWSRGSMTKVTKTEVITLFSKLLVEGTKFLLAFAFSEKQTYCFR